MLDEVGNGNAEESYSKRTSQIDQRIKDDDLAEEMCAAIEDTEPPKPKEAPKQESINSDDLDDILSDKEEVKDSLVS